MRILLVGSFKYPMYADAFKKAWERMGHIVEPVDYESFQYKRGCIGRLMNRIQARYLFGVPMVAYNKSIIKAVDDFNPDLVFLYRCNNVYGSTIKAIKDKSMVFSYHNDDPFSGVPSKAFYRFYIQVTHFCRINYVYRKKNLYDLQIIGIGNAKVLLPYYIESRNYPKDCEKDIPVSFIGHYEPDGRDEIILDLVEAGVDIRVFGSEWHRSRQYSKIQGVLSPAVDGDAYNDLINRSQILLVFFSKRNHDTYTRRSFEIPAACGFMLSEYTEDMDKMFPEGEAAAYFRTPKEAVEKCLHYLSDDVARKRIAKNAYLKMKEMGGSEYNRAEEVIRDYYDIINNTLPQ